MSFIDRNVRPVRKNILRPRRLLEPIQVGD